MTKPYFFLFAAATVILFSPGCMISHDLYFYTKARIVKEENRMRIVDGYNLVLASELVDATYDPPVEKHLFMEFNTAYPPLKIEHKANGSSVKVYLLIRQGENCWYCDNLAGTVTILRRTRDQILTEIDIAAHVVFDPKDTKGRREVFGPHYIYRRAADDTYGEEIDEMEAFR